MNLYNPFTWLLMSFMTIMANYVLFKNINKTEYKLQDKDLIVLNIIMLFLMFLVLIKFDMIYHIIIYSLLCIVLAVIALLDFRHKIILDRLNIIIAILAVINIAVTKSYYSSLLGFLIFFTIFLVLSLLSGGGIGGGDIKMIGATGLFFGLAATYQIITWSFLYAGAVVVPRLIFFKKKDSVALGPYISLGILTFVLYWT